MDRDSLRRSPVPLALLLLLSIRFSADATAGTDFSPVERCGWGYTRTASVVKNSSLQTFSPEGASSWELCKLAFEPDPSNGSSSWVTEALGFLETLPKNLKPIELITKRGQCELGSILYQKKFLPVQDSVTIKLTAQGVCKSLPATFLKDD